MKTYTVYRHPVEGMEAVKAGFSWPAFLFSSAWMLDKGLWRLAAGWFAIAAAIAAVLVLLAHLEASHGLMFVCFALAAGLSLIPGINGNRWWERDLLERKYQRMTSLRARTPEDAIAEVAEAADMHARIVRLPLHSTSSNAY